MAFFMPYLYPRTRMQWPRKIFALGLTALIIAVACPVFADNDLFQFDRAHWMSFDRYKEKSKNGAVSTIDTPTEADSSAATDSSSEAHDAKGDTTIIAPPTMKSEIAAPTRPINVPVMPGMNKGYDMQVNSTEDEKPPIAHITNIETQPTLTITTKNWQTPKEAAQHSNNEDDTDENEHQPLDVRMSFLPNTQISPIPSPEYKSTHGRKTPTAIAAVPATESTKSPAELAACAAIDAYKKRQLEAIEGDRQTLAALQGAIAQLGLQKELSFMSGANGKVNQANSSPIQMDMPPSLAKSQKN